MSDIRHGLFFEPPLENNFWGHIFEEVYKSNLYQPYIPTNKAGKSVLDVGGNVGITSYFFHDKFEKVYTIEPSANHFATIEMMLKYNNITNVYPFKFALSNTDGKSPFYQYPDNLTMNSLYPNLQPNSTKDEVELKRLDTFFKEQKIEHLDLMKIDCEGVEYEILCGDSFADVADKIDCVIGEVHTFSGRNPNQIKDALEDKGFKFKWHEHDANLFEAKK
jgi:FkbM family methyltransferase